MTGLSVAASPTLAARGSRSSARTRTTMSRSVRIPMHLSPPASSTGMPPTPLMRICWAASVRLVSARTGETSLLM